MRSTTAGRTALLSCGWTGAACLAATAVMTGCAAIDAVFGSPSEGTPRPGQTVEPRQHVAPVVPEPSAPSPAPGADVHAPGARLLADRDTAPAAPEPVVTSPQQVAVAPEPTDYTYLGYTGERWNRGYGVPAGGCDVAAAGKALGSSTEARNVAILTSASLGRRLGATLSASDRACIGHTLELVRNGRTVRWHMARADASLIVTPVRHFRRGEDACREFTVALMIKGKSRQVSARACRLPGGNWQGVN